MFGLVVGRLGSAVRKVIGRPVGTHRREQRRDLVAGFYGLAMVVIPLWFASGRWAIWLATDPRAVAVSDRVGIETVAWCLVVLVFGSGVWALARGWVFVSRLSGGVLAWWRWARRVRRSGRGDA